MTSEPRDRQVLTASDARGARPARRRPHFARWVIVAACLALVTAGCTESDGSAGGGGSGSSTTKVDAAKVLGKKDPASGEPLKIGFSTDGGSTGITDTASQDAAMATVEYVNDYLGGIGGRPIELEVCKTDASPEGATRCGNQFVEDEVATVLVGASGVGGDVATPVVAADIPYVSYQAGSAPELTSPDYAYSVASGIGGFGALAKYSADKGYEEMAAFVIDVPAATGVYDAFSYVFDNAEVKLEVVGIPPGTADMTSQVTANKDADVFQVLGDSAFCSAAIPAMRAVAPDTPIITNQQCVDASAIQAIGEDIEGVVLITTSDLTATDNEDLDTMNAVFDEYAPSDMPREGNAVNGYSVVLSLARMTEGLEGDPTPEAINEAIKTSRGQTLPLSSEKIDLACGDSPVSFLPAVCNLGVFTTELDAEGKPTTYDFVDSTELIAAN